MQSLVELLQLSMGSIFLYGSGVEGLHQVHTQAGKHHKDHFEVGTLHLTLRWPKERRGRDSTCWTSRGGPFKDSGEFEKFLKDNVKQQMMKLEVQFARESTTLLPNVDPIFRIQITLHSGKRRMNTAQEFGDTLMSYLGKRSDQATLE